jgi:DMSO/TMAO reductase YedYZ molybdopterin-dependent catalytic subunit
METGPPYAPTPASADAPTPASADAPTPASADAPTPASADAPTPASADATIGLRAGAVAGALAGGVALLVLLVGQAFTGANGLLETIHNGVTRYVPLELFDAGIGTFGPYAKGLLFVGIAVALVVAGALVGALLVRAQVVGRGRPIGEALAVAGLVWLLSELVVLPLFGVGLFGVDLPADPLAVQVPLAVASLAFGAVLVGIVRGAADRTGQVPRPGDGAHDPDRALPDVSRRTFLGRVLVIVGLGSLALSGVAVFARVRQAGTLNAAVRPGVVPAGEFGPTPAVTPLADFYTISKDVLPRVVDGASWRLSVGGLVARPREYTLDELRALPAEEGYRTLQCISNQVTTYGRYIGNQRWRGVPARDVLGAAGVEPEARFVLWRSADGYTESLPVEVALDPRTWLAYEMGPPGQLLTPEHGFPLRVLIAGRYGMKQPKWLTEIVLSESDEPGYWEERGWDQTAAVRTYSRIDLPLDGDQVAADRPFEVHGIASSGDRGIARVEVSGDDGATWRDAELEPEGGPISDLSWVRWRTEVQPVKPGRITLLARATDDLGNVQDATPRASLPSGATGLHRVIVVAVD